MQTDQQPGNPYVWIGGFCLLLTLLLVFASALQSPPGHREPLNGSRSSAQPVGFQVFEKPGSTQEAGLASGTDSRADSVRKIKLDSRDLAALSDTSNKSNSPFVHRLPPQFFQPQSLESTRRAGLVLQDLHAAQAGAGSVRKQSIPGDPGKGRAGK